MVNVKNPLALSTFLLVYSSFLYRESLVFRHRGFFINIHIFPVFKYATSSNVLPCDTFGIRFRIRMVNVKNPLSLFTFLLVYSAFLYRGHVIHRRGFFINFRIFPVSKYATPSNGIPCDTFGIRFRIRMVNVKNPLTLSTFLLVYSSFLYRESLVFRHRGFFINIHIFPVFKYATSSNGIPCDTFGIRFRIRIVNVKNPLTLSTFLLVYSSFLYRESLVFRHRGFFINIHIFPVFKYATSSNGIPCDTFGIRFRIRMVNVKNPLTLSTFLLVYPSFFLYLPRKFALPSPQVLHKYSHFPGL